MVKNTILEKVRGKNIHYIDFDDYANTLLSHFDTKSYQDIFRWDSGVGIAIEPMTEAQKLQKRRGEEIQIDTKGFQENSICLLFYKEKEIDKLIDGLNACKKRLHKKAEQKKQEEYRRKFYGRIVQMKDILAKASVSQ